VHATAQTWASLRTYPVRQRQVVPLRTPTDLGGIVFEAFPVEHSVFAPADGYRISAGGRSVFYVPDVAAIPDEAEALGGIDLYVGDGSTVTRPMLRRSGGRLIGHAPVRVQLDWCRRRGVRRAVFTHCGSQIVRGDGRALAGLVRRLGRERGVDARIACDGLELEVG